MSSPYTRALQTAAILSKELGIDIVVESDLHEWLANKNYIYDEDSKAEQSYKEFIDCQGEYLDGVERVWEDNMIMRRRVLSVLGKYGDDRDVIVACHGMIIQAVTEKHYPDYGEIMEFELS